MESRLGQPSLWPHDAEQAERFRGEVVSISESVPSTAPARVLFQIDRLYWGIESVSILQGPENPSTHQLEEVYSNIEELLARRPVEPIKEIEKALEARIQTIQPLLRAHQQSQLLERANLALNDKDDASVVFSRLEEFRESQAVDAARGKLCGKVFQTTAQERLGTLERNLQKSIATSANFDDDRPRGASLLAIQDALIQLIVDSKLQDEPPQKMVEKAQGLLLQCDNELRTIAAKEQEDRANEIRRYQAWALEQIRKFDSPQGWYYEATLPWVRKELDAFASATNDEEWLALQEFPSIREVIQQKLTVVVPIETGAMLTAAKRKEIYTTAWERLGWKNSIDTEIAYRATRDGMVKFLLPIQVQLLDPPVAALYHEAFSKGWQKLAGREDQLFVAKQSAEVRKRLLDDVQAAGP